ncbi:hypothetical protein EON63_10070 [archaeon]|nr:MAG: hypothetical protein EON63_10070 [archaeon]
MNFYYIVIVIILMLATSACWKAWKVPRRHGKSTIQMLSTENHAENIETPNHIPKYRRVPTIPELTWSVRAIGRVECSYLNKFSVPRQATIHPTNKTTNGTILSTSAPEIAKLVIFPEYRACLDDLKGFDYLWLIGLFHLNSGFKTHIHTRPVSPEHPVPSEVGLFSSRSPHRPNPLSLSALRIVNVSTAEGVVHVEGVDMMHDSPILDIKPYLPAFDSFPEARSGWMDLIQQDYMQARVTGYQNIVSTRGARFARAMEKKAARAEEGLKKDN